MINENTPCDRKASYEVWSKREKKQSIAEFAADMYAHGNPLRKVDADRLRSIGENLNMLLFDEELEELLDMLKRKEEESKQMDLEELQNAKIRDDVFSDNCFYQNKKNYLMTAISDLEGVIQDLLSIRLRWDDYRPCAPTKEDSMALAEYIGNHYLYLQLDYARKADEFLGNEFFVLVLRKYEEAKQRKIDEVLWEFKRMEMEKEDPTCKEYGPFSPFDETFATDITLADARIDVIEEVLDMLLRVLL